MEYRHQEESSQEEEGEEGQDREHPWRQKEEESQAGEIRELGRG